MAAPAHLVPCGPCCGQHCSIVPCEQCRSIAVVVSPGGPGPLGPLPARGWWGAVRGGPPATDADALPPPPPAHATEPPEARGPGPAHTHRGSGGAAAATRAAAAAAAAAGSQTDRAPGWAGSGRLDTGGRTAAAAAAAAEAAAARKPRRLEPVSPSRPTDRKVCVWVI
jgi:hypothetical protein